MTVDDIPQVTEIERESFPTTWPQAAYRRELQSNTMARYLVVADSAAQQAHEDQCDRGGLAHNVRRILGHNRPHDGAEPSDERLVAFLGLWFILEECHVVTVAVRQGDRRRGIGELLVVTAVDMALRKNQELLTLECRLSNTGAQTLYQRYGFEIVGRRKRYYSDNNEDALIMTTPPIQTTEYRARFERLRAEHQQRWGAPLVTHPELDVGRGEEAGSGV